MFVVDPSPVIEWPVTVSLPVDGGEIADFRFTGIFKRMSDVALDEILGVGKTVATDEAETGRRMRDVLRENAEIFPELLVGWKEVKTASGDEVPFCVEVLKAQIIGLNGRFLSAGIWRAVAEIRSGARLKN